MIFLRKFTNNKVLLPLMVEITPIKPVQEVKYLVFELDPRLHFNKQVDYAIPKTFMVQRKFGAPAYMSYPHFYLADPGYIHDVDGMSPNAELHATKMALEPSTGMPLHVKAAFQLNLLMSQMEGIE
ncbi:hypothetical protein D910_09209 [Dendroctonus ponderosae]